MSEFDEILVAVDGSEPAHRAAQFAARLRPALGVPIRLAYVIPATPESIMGLANMSREDVEAIEQKKARSVLDTIRSAMGDEGADAGEIVMIGDPAEEIVNYTERHPKAMVVMGRRGLSTFRSLLVGSVSEKVVRHSRNAVTLVA